MHPSTTICAMWLKQKRLKEVGKMSTWRSDCLRTLFAEVFLVHEFGSFTLLDPLLNSWMHHTLGAPVADGFFDGLCLKTNCFDNFSLSTLPVGPDRAPPSSLCGFVGPAPKYTWPLTGLTHFDICSLNCVFSFQVHATCSIGDFEIFFHLLQLPYSELLVTANVPSSPIFVTLMMEALNSPETSVLTGAIWHNIPEDDILHSHCCENLKSYIYCICDCV
jgi:hypothetical protein